MKIKQITTILAALAIFALPVASYANTYQYVDSVGQLQSTQANSPGQAIATANNIGLHSGVMLVGVDGIGGIGGNDAPPTTTNTEGSFYQFVDANNNIQSMNAISPEVALATAYNIGLHSGVVLVTNSTALTN